MGSERCLPSGAKAGGGHGAPGCETWTPAVAVCAASGRGGAGPFAAGQPAAAAVGRGTGL